MVEADLIRNLRRSSPNSEHFEEERRHKSPKKDTVVAKHHKHIQIAFFFCVPRRKRTVCKDTFHVRKPDYPLRPPARLTSFLFNQLRAPQPLLNERFLARERIVPVLLNQRPIHNQRIKCRKRFAYTNILKTRLYFFTAFSYGILPHFEGGEGPAERIGERKCPKYRFSWLHHSSVYAPAPAPGSFFTLTLRDFCALQ